jgi:hypothetical protein
MHQASAPIAYTTAHKNHPAGGGNDAAAITAGTTTDRFQAI